EGMGEGVAAVLELSNDFTTHTDDVVGLRPDALLVGWRTTGTLRAGGGAFERDLWLLFVFGADGRLRRWEQFDHERVDLALARFDALATAPPAAHRHVSPPRSAARRVRPNAASANAARVEAAVLARDAEGVPSLYA